MTAIQKTNILFDDFSILTKLVEKEEFNILPPAIDCDCTSHPLAADHQDADTNQITPSAGQTY